MTEPLALFGNFGAAPGHPAPACFASSAPSRQSWWCWGGILVGPAAMTWWQTPSTWAAQQGPTTWTRAMDWQAQCGDEASEAPGMTAERLGVSVEQLRRRLGKLRVAA